MRSLTRSKGQACTRGDLGEEQSPQLPFSSRLSHPPATPWAGWVPFTPAAFHTAPQLSLCFVHLLAVEVDKENSSLNAAQAQQTHPRNFQRPGRGGRQTVSGGGGGHLTFVGPVRRHPTDSIHPLSYLDFKLRTDKSPAAGAGPSSSSHRGSGKHLWTQAKDGHWTASATAPPKHGAPHARGAVPQVPQPSGRDYQHPLSGGAQIPGQTGRAASQEGGLPAPLPRDWTAAETTRQGRGPSFLQLWGLQRAGCTPPPAVALPHGLQMGLSAAK